MIFRVDKRNFWKNTKKQRNRKEEEEEEKKGQRAKSRFIVDDRNVLGNWANQRCLLLPPPSIRQGSKPFLPSLKEEEIFFEFPGSI